MTTAGTAERTIHVWDLPTRLFHWSLLALVVVAWFTGEEEGAAALLHRYAGEAIAGLLVFRVIWGFAGGERARFADFAAGPSAILAHVREEIQAGLGQWGRASLADSRRSDGVQIADVIANSLFNVTIGSPRAHRIQRILDPMFASKAIRIAELTHVA